MQTLWEHYAVHRRRITSLLLDAAPARPGTLALLGAGRCRDVDLPELAARYERLHLVDRERRYLEEAYARQPAHVRRRLHLHAGVELGGIVEHLDVWRTSPPGAVELAHFVATFPEGLARRLPACDVVASTCLLSQLAYEANERLGPEHPALDDVRAALLTSHLRALVALTRPGGQAFLINDVAVAARGELEARVVANGPRAVLDALVTTDAPLRCSPPPAVEAGLRSDEHVPRRVARHDLLEPWLWTRTAELTYLIFAVRIWLRA